MYVTFLSFSYINRSKKKQTKKKKKEKEKENRKQMYIEKSDLISFFQNR